jgi:hypothetical protein
MIEIKNKITARDLTLMLLLLVLGAVGLIFAPLAKSFIIFLCSISLFASFFGAFLKAIKDDWTGYITFIGWLAAIIIACACSLIQTDGMLKFNRLYYKENIVDFEEHIKSVQQKKSHRFIFAFDNSGAQLNRELDNNSQQLQKIYFRNYYTFAGLLPDDCPDKFHYKNLLISRLCFDLTKINQDTNKENFRIVKIGQVNNTTSLESSDWKEITIPNIKEIVNRFIVEPTETQLNDEITNLLRFYQDIKSYTSDTSYTYSLFIYSDFVHDMTKTHAYEKYKKGRLDKDQSDIVTIQEELAKNKNIQIQNVFHIPNTNNLYHDERYVLPKEEKNVRLYQITATSENMPIEHRHQTSHNLILYHSGNKRHTTASLILNFKEKNHNTHFIEPIDGFSIHSHKNGEVAEIKYDADALPEKTAQIQSTYNGIHIVSSLVFDIDNAWGWKTFWIIAFIAIGFVGGYYVFWIKK